MASLDGIEDPGRFALNHASRVMVGDEIRTRRGGPPRTVLAVEIVYRLTLAEADGEPYSLEAAMSGPGSHVFHRPRRPRLLSWAR